MSETNASPRPATANTRPVAAGGASPSLSGSSGAVPITAQRYPTLSRPASVTPPPNAPPPSLLSNAMPKPIPEADDMSPAAAGARPQMRQIQSVVGMAYPRTALPNSPPSTPPQRSGSFGGSGGGGGPPFAASAGGAAGAAAIGTRAQPPPPSGPRPSHAQPVSPSLQRSVSSASMQQPPPPPRVSGALLPPGPPSRVPAPPPVVPMPSLPPPPSLLLAPTFDSVSPRGPPPPTTAPPPLTPQNARSTSSASPGVAYAASNSTRADSSSNSGMDSRDSLSDDPLARSSPSGPGAAVSPREAAASPRHVRQTQSGVPTLGSPAGAPSAAPPSARRGVPSSNMADLPPPSSPMNDGDPRGLQKSESKPLKFFGVSSENTGAPTEGVSREKKEEKEKEKKKWMALFSMAPKKEDAAAENAQQSRLLYSERETELLQQIVALIIFKIPGVIVAMYEHIEKEKQEQLSAAFVNTSFGPSLATMTLIEYLVEEEFVSNLSAGKEILRENGLAIRFLRAYLKCVSGDFLQTLLGDFVEDIMADKKLSLEIDPSKASPEELPTNMRELQARVSALIAHMSSKRVLDAMPPGLRMACHYVHEQARKHRPTHTRIYLGSFLMLRFINPALFSPETHSLVPGNKPIAALARRNLILVSKILQNVSNDITQSKKEPYMNGLDAGGRWQQMLYDWFEELVQVRYNPQSVHERVTATPTAEHLHLLHALVFQYRAQLTQALEPADRKELDSLLERLGSYQHKESFSFLEDEHNRLVRQLLQSRQDEASYLGYIQVQKKAKKNVELVKGILIITRCRIILLAENGKIGADVHQLQLTRIRSSISDHFELIFDDKAILGVCKEVDQIIAIIHRSFMYTFPGMPQEMRFQLDVQPPSRLAHLTSAPLHVEPCDSLVPAYRSVCDLYQVPPVLDLCWDLEHLYTSATTLDLVKFTDHYRSPITDIQALPLLHALGYNRQITSLVVADIKFQETTFKGLVEMAKMNCTLRSITLRNITVGGGKGGSSSGSARAMIGLFFNAMQSNLSLPIAALNLSGTLLDDKGAFALSGFVANLERSFESLNLRGVLDKKDVKTVLQGFQKNPRATSALRTLDWSETRFVELSAELAEVVAKCSELRSLTLQETGVAIGTLITKGIRNNTRALERLDLSHNKFGKDTAWNGLADLLQSDAHHVSELDISDTQVPVSVLQQLLMITEGHVGILAAQNNFGSAGARSLGEIASKISCVDKLDLADNSMGDVGLAALLEGLCNNQSLTWLRLDNNYKESGDKHRRAVLHQLEMLANSICPLEVFKFAGSGGKRVGSALDAFIHALAHNTTLTELDVAGHGFGDTGAMALARVLQQNQVLQCVHYDDNQTGLIGYLNLADAISSNKTLRSMPIPFLDVAQLLNSARDGSEKEKISKVLARLDLSAPSRHTDF